ncbi:BLUF domain-containing protein [Aquibium sp. LZ166]|uniref:BLUF domain-containing protein n=1 Tax=Aquibium pacificus TaxID=3153579 RepID=A0ABV3SP64_9HYPH
MAGMLRLLYASGATERTTDELLDAILTVSRRNNAREGITGMLLAGEGVFLQVLEGEVTAVRSLVSRIRRDPRHRNVMILNEETISRRLFGNWDMGFKKLDASHGDDRKLFPTTRAALENRISRTDGGIMLDTVLAFSTDFLAPV